MRTLTIAAVLCLLADGAFAQTATCAAQASEKRLAGAARTSFAKKCCDTQAAERKLAGAAKTSFTEKCLKDAGS
jgi:psiF repeat